MTSMRLTLRHCYSYLVRTSLHQPSSTLANRNRRLSVSLRYGPGAFSNRPAAIVTVLQVNEGVCKSFVFRIQLRKCAAEIVKQAGDDYIRTEQKPTAVFSKRPRQLQRRCEYSISNTSADTYDHEPAKLSKTESWS